MEYPEVPEIERLDTCMIVRMPAPKNYVHRQILATLNMISFNVPADLTQSCVFVVPYESDRVDLEMLWQTIQANFGKFVYVEKVV